MSVLVFHYNQKLNCNFDNNRFTCTEFICISKSVCLENGIPYSTLYKWLKSYNQSKEAVKFVSLTNKSKSVIMPTQKEVIKVYLLIEKLQTENEALKSKLKANEETISSLEKLNR